MDPTTNNKQQVLGSNKIRQIVRLQQLLKKWKRIAAASPSSTHLQLNNSSSSSSSINKFLKKTLSFSEKDKLMDRSSDEAVPKGCLAVCVGKEEEEKKRFVIPMDYLAHQSFQVLLREAEEEFGFQQQGVLKIPCQVSLFHNILKTIQSSSSSSNKTQQPEPAADHDDDNNTIIHNVGCCSPDNHQHMTERPSSASFILIN